MRPIIGVGIDCSKKQHKVCISDNFGKKYGLPVVKGKKTTLLPW
jgi:hypothetical protein